MWHHFLLICFRCIAGSSWQVQELQNLNVDESDGACADERRAATTSFRMHIFQPAKLSTKPSVSCPEIHACHQEGDFKGRRIKSRNVLLFLHMIAGDVEAQARFRASPCLAGRDARLCLHDGFGRGRGLCHFQASTT